MSVRNVPVPVFAVLVMYNVAIVANSQLLNIVQLFFLVAVHIGVVPHFLRNVDREFPKLIFANGVEP